MNKYNYFEYDGDIPSWYSLLDTAKELIVELKEREEYEETEDEELFEEEEAEAPEYLPSPEPLEAPKPSLADTAELPEEEDDLSHAPEEITSALKAFDRTHREGEIEELHRPSIDVPLPEPLKKNTAPKKKERKKEKLTLFQRLFVKRASRLKRFFITLLGLIFIFVIFTGVVYFVIQSINHENSKITEFNSNAASVCSNLTRQYGHADYENLYSIYNIEGYRLTGLCFVRELDFNNDGESELMVTYNKNGLYINEVWGTNEDGGFSCLFTGNAAQTENRKDDAYSVLYRTNNKYYIAKFGNDITEMKLYQFKSGKFSERYDAKYEAKTDSFTVNGKDATNEVEKITYSVLKDLKASLMVETALDTVDSFTVGGVEENRPVIEQSINTAYYNIVQEYNKRYGVSALKDDKGGIAYVDGLAVVKLIDFDGDEKDELLLVYRKPIKVRSENSHGNPILLLEYKYFCDIYRYSGNKAVLSYSNEGISNKLNTQSDIYYMIRYRDKKAYYCTNSFTSEDYGKHLSAVSTQLEFDGTQFKSNYKVSYEQDYGNTHYYIEGESVGKRTFDEKGYMLPFFDGEEKYDEDIYKVTYVQRRSSKKDSMKDIPTQTEKEIQKLNQLYTSDMVQN